MKNPLLLFVLFSQSIAFSQKTILQDNLFNNTAITVLVQDCTNYKTLQFNDKEALKIYTWKYETVYKAFITEFVKDPDLVPADSIISEIGRVFYTVTMNERINNEENIGPSAGAFGFEKKEVAIQRSEQDYKWTYKADLKAAVKYFQRNKKIIKDIRKNPTKYLSVQNAVTPVTSKQTVPLKGKDSMYVDSTLFFNPDSEFSKNLRKMELSRNTHKSAINKYLIYKHFLLDTSCRRIKLFDTIVKDDISHDPKKLKYHGLKPFYENLSLRIDSLFNYLLDPNLNKYDEYQKNKIAIYELKQKISDLSSFYIEGNKQEIIGLSESIRRTKTELDSLQKISETELRAQAEKLSAEININWLDWIEILNPYNQYLIPDSILRKEKYNLLSGYFDKFKLQNSYRLDTLRLVELKLRLSEDEKELQSMKENLEILNKNTNKIRNQLGFDNDTDYEKQRKLNSLWLESKKKIEAFSIYKNEVLKFIIDSIDVEISRTFIENIAVYGKAVMFDFQKKDYRQLENRNMTFYNHVPLGISTLTSIEDALNGTKLYGGVDGKIYEMNLGHVMAFYRPKLQNYRTDLSPADTTFTLVKQEEMQQIPMLKTPTKRLFEMRVYSDFVGLNGKTPNGLVQTEVSKEMYLNSKKKTVEGRKGWYMNFSAGTYISPYVILSKLEQTNKHLPLFEYTDSEPLSSLYAGNKLYATTVQLKRYENFSAGADLNLFYVAIPRWKTQFYLDPGIAYGRTGVIDSIPENDTVRTPNEYGVNTISTKLTLKVVFQTDERYFFDVRAGLQWLNLINNKISQTQRFDTPSLMVAPRFDQKVLFTLGLNAGFSPTSNTSGKLFFRYNYYGLVTKKARDGFSQIQLGYSYYLKN